MFCQRRTQFIGYIRILLAESLIDSRTTIQFKTGTSGLKINFLKTNLSTTPCHVGTLWKALNEYSQMSIHVSGFQSFFRFLHTFALAQLATSSIRVKNAKKNKSGSDSCIVVTQYSLVA